MSKILRFSSISNTNFGKLARLPLNLIPGHVVLRIFQGPAKGNKWIKGSATNGCWLDSYEADKVQEFASVIREDMIIYDVGANVGYYTIIAARKAKRGVVYAFEPLPRNVEFLRKHLAINKISNAHIFDLAVADTSGEAGFSQGVDPSMAKLTEGGELRVAITSLDALVLGQRIRPPDLIKMDIEGAEYQALSGAEKTINRFHPMIFLAIHSHALRQSCMTWLQNHGYEVIGCNGLNAWETDELFARSSSCLGKTHA